MPITNSISDDGKVVTIFVEERFDFSLHQTFREAYSHSEAKGVTFILDLKDTSYMDSSALGMILLLKDHADNHSSNIRIVNPNESVYKILFIAQFNRLMEIEK